MEHFRLASGPTDGIKFDFGTFEGFKSGIERSLTASDVIGWNDDIQGETKFWPAGDRAELSVLFRQDSVTAGELLDLNRILTDLGDDSIESFLRVHHAVSGCDLAGLTSENLMDLDLYLFFGENFTDLRRDAACEMFRLFYPEAYEVLEKTLCDGLIFDTNRFLDSPSWFVEEVDLHASVAIIICPQQRPSWVYQESKPSR